MKYLILLLLFLCPALAGAQVSTSLSDGGYYYVVVQGDTVSQHTRVDKAIESASNYSDWEIVQDFRLSGSSLFYDEDIIIEEVTDTVYIKTPAHDQAIIESVDWTYHHDFEKDSRELDFRITTQNADTLITEVRCGNRWIKEQVFPDSTDQIAPPADSLMYGILLDDCDQDVTYQFEAIRGGWASRYTERIPAFFLTLQDLN